tara:strand:- start:143 stop:1663 length:1521 start_codon:yes stop_codon:yes gene_type:complete
MPRATNHKNLKLHYNTWVVRIVIPQDIRPFFPARDKHGDKVKGRFLTEFIQSTHKKQNQLDEAVLIRDGIVSDFNVRKRQIRSGDIDPIEDQMSLLRDRYSKLLEAKKDFDGFDDEMAEGIQEESYAIMEEALEDACNRFVNGGASAVYKERLRMYKAGVLNRENSPPTEYDAIESLAGVHGLRRVQQALALIRGETFDAKLEDYMQLREVRSLSNKYQAEIRTEITRFTKDFPTIQQVKYSAVKAWTRKLEEQNKASKTINKKLSKLNGYWKFLEELQVVNSNQKPPFIHLNVSSTKPRNRRPWNLEDTQKLFTVPSKQTQRDPLLLSFMTVSLFTGMRLGEIARLQTSNIKAEDNVRFIDINREITKSDAGVRKVPICSKLIPIIDALLQTTKSDYLFPPSTKPLQTAGQERDLGNKWGHKFGRHKTFLGYEKHVDCFHGFRHTANVFLSKEGIDVARREVLIGWESGRKKSMAETNYGHIDIEYPLATRRKDIELLCRLYPFI